MLFNAVGVMDENPRVPIGTQTQILNSPGLGF
jgi:hypothetical protein